MEYSGINSEELAGNQEMCYYLCLRSNEEVSL